MDDKSKSSISSNMLPIVVIVALIIIVAIGLVASGSVKVAGITGNSSSQNPSKLSGEVMNYSAFPDGGVYELKIRLTGSNLPEGQKNYFKVIGNLNGTPADDLWFEFPEGSKLATGMIITVSGPEDFSTYNSFTIYLYDQPLYDENNMTVDRDPITNITITNPSHK